MGQRLNVEILKNEELLSNAYYHWAGFSNTSFNNFDDLVLFVNEHLDESFIMNNKVYTMIY